MDGPRHSHLPGGDKSVHCPSCQRLIYTRRRADCEWCGHPLPEELRLSKAEIEAIDAEIDERDLARGERQALEEKEREKRRQDTAAITPFFFTGL